MFNLSIQPSKIAGTLNVETARKSYLIRRFDGAVLIVVSR